MPQQTASVLWIVEFVPNTDWRTAAVYAQYDAVSEDESRVVAVYLQYEIALPSNNIITVKKECGFEGGLAQMYEDEGWTLGGLLTDADKVHGDLNLEGSKYSCLVDGMAESPVFEDGSNWFYCWYKFLDTKDFNFSFKHSGDHQFEVRVIQATGQVKLYRWNTLVASSALGAVNTLVPHWYGVFMIADATSGRCIVFADGVEVVDTGAGANTQNSGAPGWDQVLFGDSGSGCGESYGALDDVLVVLASEPGDDPTPIPEKHIQVSAVASDAEPNDFDPSTPGVDHHTLVNEIPVSTTDYLDGSGDTEQELFGLTTLTSMESVLCVGVWAWMGRNASDLTHAQIWVERSDLYSYFDAQLLNASPGRTVVSNVVNYDPGGEDWSTSVVNDLKVGLKVTT